MSKLITKKIAMTHILWMQDYLLSYRDRIQAVTSDQVLQAAKRHLHPLDQQVVVVADAAANQEQLEMQARTVLPLKLS